VSVALPIPLIQLLQVLTVAVGAPWVTGVIAKVEARLQGRRGPRVRQPYYDLAKLFLTRLPDRRRRHHQRRPFRRDGG
jgi:formate hydrogenlyase subunit 4